MQADTKTRERKEGAVKAVQAMHGIAVLQIGSIPTRYVLPASVMTAPDIRHSLIQETMPW